MSKNINRILLVFLTLSLTATAQIRTQNESDRSLFFPKPYQLEGAGCKNIDIIHSKKNTFEKLNVNE